MLDTRTYANNKFRSVKFSFPDDWIGAKHLSMWVDGVKVSKEDLYFAVDNLDNKAIRQVGSSSQQMSITIDCGAVRPIPTNCWTYWIHRREGDVFVTGHWVDSYPEYLREIVNRGHEIGNHTIRIRI